VIIMAICKHTERLIHVQAQHTDKLFIEKEMGW